MNKKYLILIFGMFFLSFVSATITCTPSSITTSYNEGDLKQISTTCQNDGNSTTISITGETQIISTTETNFNAGQKTIFLDLSSTASPGLHTGTLLFGTGYSVPIFFQVYPTQSPINPSAISFPTSKNINVKQGETKVSKVTLILPSNFPAPINIVAIEFSDESDLISFGDLETGIVNPGSSKDIPLLIDATDADVGTYPVVDIIVRYDDGGIHELRSTIAVSVNSNINPITGDTFSSSPNCALSATTINLNETHSLTCSGVVNNLEVNPEVNEFFEGISVDTTQSIYTYTFRAVKFGNTDFKASFSYKGSPLFTPFKQEVRIASVGGGLQGTDLAFLFTPTLDTAQNGETIGIQLVDNKTNSLVLNPQIEIDAIPLSNASGRTFFFQFNTDKNYSIRGSAIGYNDLVTSIRLSSKPIEIHISPETGNTNTQFNITSDMNATIFIDGENKGVAYFGVLTAGNHQIEAFKEGYLDTVLNLTVESSIIFSSSGEFKKGVLQTFTINKNVSWRVSYQEDTDSVIELLNEGTGDKIEFEPKKKGTYILEAEDARRTYIIEGFNWNAKWWFMKWYWWVVLPAVIIYSYIKFTNPSSSLRQVDVGFSGNTRY